MHPLLFEISLGSLGAWRVPAFGALLALAFGAGLGLTLRLATRAGLPRDPVLSACLRALLGGILGSRLGYVLLHTRELASFADAFSLWDGGLAGSVGLALGAGALAWEARRRALPLGTLFDAAAPGLAFGVVLTRVGCWLEGCDFGKPLAASAPHWLARLGTFPFGSRAWVEQVLSQRLAADTASALPVHPSELYESFGALGLLALAVMLGRRQRSAGTTALVVLAAVGLLRVLVDFTRAPSADVWCARVLLLLGGALTVQRARRWRTA